MPNTQFNWSHPVSRVTAFRIFCDARGRWCASSSDGMVGGTFFAREAALRFARRESGISSCPCCRANRR